MERRILHMAHPLVIEAEDVLGARRDRYPIDFGPEPEHQLEAGTMRVALVYDKDSPEGSLTTRVIGGKAFIAYTTRVDLAKAQVGQVAAAVGKMVRWALEKNEPGRLVVQLPLGCDMTSIMRGTVVALQEGSFRKTEDRYIGPDSVRFLGDHFGHQEHEGKGSGCYMNLAAWLCALPPNELGPPQAAGLIDRLVTDLLPRNPKVELLEPTQGQMERMGLLRAVASASEVPPQVTAFVVHPPTGPTKEMVGVIGKGVCMDSGGFDLKDHMRGMKGDMRGAAVASALGMLAIRYPELLTRSTLFAAGWTYNLVGPRGYMPDGVYEAYNGQKVEIDNTDAEGRLVLADIALWAKERYPNLFPITIATLTGAAHVISGDDASVAIVSGDETDADRVWRLRRYIEERGNEVGDPFDTVRFRPSHAAHMKKGTFADMKNLSGLSNRQLGCQTAYGFLHNFLGHGVHLDIARGAAFGGDPASGRASGLSNDAGFCLLRDLLSYPGLVPKAA